MFIEALQSSTLEQTNQTTSTNSKVISIASNFASYSFAQATPKVMCCCCCC